MLDLHNFSNDEETKQFGSMNSIWEHDCNAQWNGFIDLSIFVDKNKSPSPEERLSSLYIWCN